MAQTSAINGKAKIRIVIARFSGRVQEANCKASDTRSLLVIRVSGLRMFNAQIATKGIGISIDQTSQRAGGDRRRNLYQLSRPVSRMTNNANPKKAAAFSRRIRI